METDACPAVGWPRWAGTLEELKIRDNKNSTTCKGWLKNLNDFLMLFLIQVAIYSGVFLHLFSLN